MGPVAWAWSECSPRAQVVVLPSHFWRAPVCSSFSALPLLPSLLLMQVDTGDPLSGSPSGQQVMSLGTVTANYTCKHLKTEHKLENLSRPPLTSPFWPCGHRRGCCSPEQATSLGLAALSPLFALVKHKNCIDSPSCLRPLFSLLLSEG